MSRSDFGLIPPQLASDPIDKWMPLHTKKKLVTDKSIHICEPMEALVADCMRNDIPDLSLTDNEHACPMKNKCLLIVFMSKQPDKFDIKFSVITEVKPYNKLGWKWLIEHHDR